MYHHYYGLAMLEDLGGLLHLRLVVVLPGAWNQYTQTYR